VRVWDLATREQVGEPLYGHGDEVLAVATALVDGRPVAVTGGMDRTVRVWDLAAREQVGPGLPFPCSVPAVAVTPDGRLVVAFGCDVAVFAPH
jgi:WD40 repeat protein